MKAASIYTVTNKSIVRVAIATTVILLIPLLAMQFTSEVNWSLMDFIVAGVLLIGIGAGFELMFGKLRGGARRVIFGAMLAAAMVLVWAELAVGIFD